jgi:hypothetical protein
MHEVGWLDCEPSARVSRDDVAGDMFLFVGPFGRDDHETDSCGQLRRSNNSPFGTWTIAKIKQQCEIRAVVCGLWAVALSGRSHLPQNPAGSLSLWLSLAVQRTP